MRWKWRSGQEPDGPAFEQNPSEPPKIKFVEKWWEHSFWCLFWGQEPECGGGRYLCDNSLSPWIGPVWANRTGSWVHKCPGASKGPEQHPCTLWTSSGLRPGQAKGKNFVLVRLSSKGKLKEFPVPPDDLNGKIGISRSTVTNQSSTWTWDVIVFNVNILNFPL